MISQNKLYAQAILRKDPHAFYERTLATTMPGVEYFRNWHSQAMAKVIEEMLYGGARRYIINIQPRMGKSLFTSVSLPMFLLMQNPAAKIMCISYSEQLAGQFHQASRLIAKKPWYRELNPALKFKSAGETATVLKETGSILQTTELGYRFATSFNGAVTGLGADWIIMDDPNDMSQIGSEAHRTKIKQTFDQTIATRLNNKEGHMILVTQRGHVDDLTGHLLEKGGFRHLKIEAVATAPTDYGLGYNQTHHRNTGELIDPRRFGIEEIEERRRDLGSAAFEAQYQQNPQPPDGNLFKRQWLHIVDTVPEFQYVAISGDIALSVGRGDFTAFLVWGYRDEVWYLIAAYRDRLDLPGVVRLYRKLDEMYEPDITAIEENGLGKGFIQRIQEVGYAHVHGGTVTGDKVERADGITPLLERKHVAILKSMPLFDPFMAELLSFPSSKFDDMVDAFTFALTRREDILRVANQHRRPKRKHLKPACGNLPEYRISGYGSRTTDLIDMHLMGSGHSIFNRW